MKDYKRDMGEEKSERELKQREYLLGEVRGRIWKGERSV